MFRFHRTAIAAAAVCVALAPPAFSQDEIGSELSPPGADEQLAVDVVGAITDHGGFATLLAALETADLLDTLRGAGPFTLFAPTDDAFEAMPTGAIEMLLMPENREDLTALLGYHVVTRAVDAKALAEMTSGIGAEPETLPTVTGKTLVIDSRVGLSVDGAEIVEPDIGAGNGIVHAIDTVLLPDAS